MRIENEHGDYVVVETRGGRTVEVVDITVRSERRKGSGTWLINHAISVVSRPETQQLYAITRATNGIAIKFYIANGFTVISRLDAFYQDQTACGDAIVYGRLI